MKPELIYLPTRGFSIIHHDDKFVEYYNESWNFKINYNKKHHLFKYGESWVVFEELFNHNELRMLALGSREDYTTFKKLNNRSQTIKKILNNV